MSKLEAMLKYVSEHNEFYKKRIKEYGITNPLDINQWPILTRKELQENRYNMFSEGYKTKYFNQHLHRQSSSGSSGMPVNVYWDYKDWYASNMSLWRKRYQWYGVKPSDKYAVFTLGAMDIQQGLDRLNYKIDPSNLLSFNTSMIKDDMLYLDIIDHIERFKPKWLYVQPYVLNKIIQAYIKARKEPPRTIKYIESVGEVLLPNLKKTAEELFNAPLANMYGSEEMNGIALENPNGEMEILSNNVFVETKSKSCRCCSGYGESIITNLNNYAMPLIRYCQNDIIQISKDNCYIEHLNGRFIDAFCVNGFEISTMLLCEAISDINNNYKSPVLEYCFKYNQMTMTLKVMLKLKNRAHQEIISKELYNKISSFISQVNRENRIKIEINISDEVQHIKNHILIIGDKNV